MSDDFRKQETLEQLDALGIRFRETDRELEPRGKAAQEWEVDWFRVAGCALVVVVGLGFWGLVIWTVARVLRGG